MGINVRKNVKTKKSTRGQPQKGNMGKYRYNKRNGCQMTHARCTLSHKNVKDKD
jgi:hypothetical protein